MSDAEQLLYSAMQYEAVVAYDRLKTTSMLIHQDQRSMLEASSLMLFLAHSTIKHAHRERWLHDIDWRI